MVESIVLPNELVLVRAVRAVAEGKTAVIPVKGNSMDPFIRGGRDKVELYPPVALQIGDVVLAKINSKQYMLHRIIRFQGEEGVVLMGDGNVGNTEYCLRKDVLAQAKVVIIGTTGKKRRLDSARMKAAASLWRRLLPVRGLLLRVYRRFRL